MKIDLPNVAPKTVTALDAKEGYIYHYTSIYFLKIYSCETVNRVVREIAPNHSFFLNLGGNPKSNQAPNLAILPNDTLLTPICEACITSVGRA
jgi:hypothetical protein